MFQLNIDSWTAMGPGINDIDAWRVWLNQGGVNSVETLPAIKLTQIPPMLRRRFSTLGKYTATVTLQMMQGQDSLSTVFASRHGDTSLTLSLLEDIGRSDDLSPTSFSLAVHNAIAGLLSIARNDVSPITAIASSNNIVLSTFQEAIAQLERHEKVLCVIYDTPLPEIYQQYTESLPFPIALAFILRRDANGELLLKTDTNLSATPVVSSEQSLFDFIAMLTGLRDQVRFTQRDQVWTLERAVQ